jgi:hypothetical protein
LARAHLDPAARDGLAHAGLEIGKHQGATGAQVDVLVGIDVVEHLDARVGGVVDLLDHGHRIGRAEGLGGLGAERNRRRDEGAGDQRHGTRERLPSTAPTEHHALS